MSSLKNLERFDVQTAEQVKHEKTWFQRFRNKIGFGTALATLSIANAHAAELPTIDTTQLLGFIALIIAAVSTVGAAILMIYMTAKGIKAIRLAM
ncbi:hypothetical protein EXU29_18380 [Acinetobacter wuhouensis]|uniref:major capsid protein n=1 Tax=Acinetobacter wuhouensis TaxID=1879050 RepID=UPI001023B725|nr:major capsid protein [Acinetobacter wuhouensis]RZG66677.1 hypothetical protein EXU29_18380 [Acinetobacter wuhouensis]